MQDRIIRLEEKVAFLEEALSKTEKIVEELNVRVLAMRHEVSDARRQASPIEDDRPQGADAPPHY